MTQDLNTPNPTHNAHARSWVASANVEGCDFPIQNLPFAVFRRAGSKETFRGGVAIGDAIVDLSSAHAAGIFSGEAAGAAASSLPPSSSGTPSPLLPALDARRRLFLHYDFPPYCTNEVGKLGGINHKLASRSRIGHANCIEVDPATGAFIAVADVSRDGGKASAY